MRHFTYNWPGNYQVDSFVVVVQRPIDASLMEISPIPYPEPGREPNQGKQAEDGMTYFTYTIGKVAAQKTFQIGIDYYKPGDELSSSSLPLQPITPINEDPTSGIALSSILPWLLGAGGLLLITGGGLWYWLSGRQKPARPHAQHRHTSPEDTEPLGEIHIYCHHCGKRASAGDRFCRACGTPLRNV